MERSRLFGLIGGTAIGTALALTLTACDDGSSSTQTTAQDTTQQAGKNLKVGKDYPLNKMHFPTAEQANVWERLLRMNNPNKIGYVTIISPQGQVIASYTIKGKVSSTGSQLLNTQDVTGCGSSCGSVVSSVGDDGTYGGEECDTGNGVFFFDTRDGLHTLCLGAFLLSYSDVPQTFVSKPVLNENADVTPSSSARGIKPTAQNPVTKTGN